MPRKDGEGFQLLDDVDAASRYLALRHSGFLARARRIDATIRTSRPIAVEFDWSTLSSEATSVGRDLWLFDREVRRAAAIIRLRRYVSLPRPVSVYDGGLRIRTAQAGSASFGLEPWGLVAGVLLSDPVQVALTVHQLIGGVRWVVVRFRRLGDGRADVPETVFELPGKVRARVPVGTTLRIKLPDGTEVEVGSAEHPPQRRKQ